MMELIQIPAPPVLEQKQLYLYGECGIGVSKDATGIVASFSNYGRKLSDAEIRDILKQLGFSPERPTTVRQDTHNTTYYFQEDAL